MTAGSVDIVIVAYNSVELLEQTLEAVEGVHEVATITVVDHGTDGSGDLAEARGMRVIRDPNNPGFGAGQNAGLTAGSAPFVLMLNPDATLEPGALASGIAALLARPQAGAVQGVIRHRSSGSVERSQGRSLAPVHLVGRALAARRLLHINAVRRAAKRIGSLADSAERTPAGPQEVEALAATALLARRAIEGIGGFDPAYFLYGEDMDLSMRLRRSGWSLVALPTAWATHEGGASSAAGLERELRWWNGTLRYAAQWWSGRAWALGTFASLVMGLRLALRSPHRVRPIVREILVRPQLARRRIRRSPASAVARPWPTRWCRGRR